MKTYIKGYDVIRCNVTQSIYVTHNSSDACDKTLIEEIFILTQKFQMKDSLKDQ